VTISSCLVKLEVAGLVLESLKEEGKLFYTWESIYNYESEFSNRVLIVYLYYSYRF
jgi:hypothetical protein